jgi:hypothetical protein
MPVSFRARRRPPARWRLGLLLALSLAGAAVSASGASADVLNSCGQHLTQPFLP